MCQELFLVYPLFINEIEIFLPIAKLPNKVNGMARGDVPCGNALSSDSTEETHKTRKGVPSGNVPYMRSKAWRYCELEIPVFLRPIEGINIIKA